MPTIRGLCTFNVVFIYSFFRTSLEIMSLHFCFLSFGDKSLVYSKARDIRPPFYSLIVFKRTCAVSARLTWRAELFTWTWTQHCSGEGFICTDLNTPLHIFKPFCFPFYNQNLLLLTFLAALLCILVFFYLFTSFSLPVPCERKRRNAVVSSLTASPLDK